MCVKIINRILLGLLFLVPGLMKLFVMGPNAVVQMLTSLRFPLPGLFAWVLILSEIVFGIAILANWKLEYTVWPPIVILIVATLTANLYGSPSGPNIPVILLHLAAISNLWLLGHRTKGTCETCACDMLYHKNNKAMRA